LARGLLKRFHAAAAKTLGETCSPEEEALRSRRDEALSNIVSFGEEVRARKNAGEPVKLASKRQLRTAITAQFKSGLGDERIDWAVLEEERELSFQIKRAGWLVDTFFDFGRKEPLLRYTHSIASEQTFPYRGARVAMVMGWCMSFNSYLGLSSQTEWHYVTTDEIESTCATVMTICSHFFDVLPKLLKGLECDRVIPDKDYELSSDPSR
jgi:hypothetical protein